MEKDFFDKSLKDILKKHWSEILSVLGALAVLYLTTFYVPRSEFEDYQKEVDKKIAEEFVSKEIYLNYVNNTNQVLNEIKGGVKDSNDSLKELYKLMLEKNNRQ
jgi:hypothetical protein